MDRSPRNVLLSDEAWELAQLAAENSHPPTTRPAWINETIIKQAKKELQNGKVKKDTPNQP